MNKKNLFLIFFSLIIFISYILGFAINENSIGSGGYNGDLKWIWENFEIFKSESLVSSIKSENFFGNRTPLLYVLNICLNPFLYDIDSYRFSIFIFSILGPLMFFLCIKKKYENLNTGIIILLSSIILLSPFYRTSAYWGLEIQYGIISSLISFYFLFKTKRIENISYLNIFFTVLFSAAAVYFDYKLILIPLLVFFKILFTKTKIEKKIFTTFFYFLSAIPLIYLIIFWGGLVPKMTQYANPLQGTQISTFKIHLVNLFFATNILGFYLFPFLILKKKILTDLKKIPNLYNGFLLSLFVLYLIYFISFDLYSYTDVMTKEFGGYKDLYGLGYSVKISNIIFEERLYSLLLNTIIYVFSFIIIILIINSKLINLFIISFFYLLSLIIFPLMQEYFDPYIFIVGILIFNKEYDFSFLKCSSVFLYFSIFLLSSYYFYL